MNEKCARTNNNKNCVYQKRAAARTIRAVSQCPMLHRFQQSGVRLAGRLRLCLDRVDTSPQHLVCIVCELWLGTINSANLAVEELSHKFYHIVYISLTPANFPPSTDEA